MLKDLERGQTSLTGRSPWPRIHSPLTGSTAALARTDRNGTGLKAPQMVQRSKKGRYRLASTVPYQRRSVDDALASAEPHQPLAKSYSAPPASRTLRNG